MSLLSSQRSFSHRRLNTANTNRSSQFGGLADLLRHRSMTTDIYTLAMSNVKPNSKRVEKMNEKRKKFAFHQATIQSDMDIHVEQQREMEHFDIREPANFIEIENMRQAYVARNARVTEMYTDIDKQILEQKNPNRLLPMIQRSASESRIQARTTQMRVEKEILDQTAKMKAKNAKEFEANLHNEAKMLSEKITKTQNKIQAIRTQNLEARSDLRQTRDEMEQFVTVSQEEEKKHMARYKRIKLSEKSEAQQKYETMLRMRQTRKENWEKAVEEVKKQISDSNIVTHELEKKLKKYREMLKQVQKTQVDHFLGLLKEGKDTRQEGLSWIVQALWKLEQEVPISSFPKFLDNEAIHCIFFIAQKTVEVDELKEKVAKIPQEIKNRARRRTNDKWNNLKQRMQKIQKSNIRIRRPNYILNKRTKQTELTWEDQYEEDLPSPSVIPQQQANDIIQYENCIQQTQDIISAAQDGELKRINREWFLNNYEERLKVSLKEVLSTIVGVELVDRKMGNLNRERRIL